MNNYFFTIRKDLVNRNQIINNNTQSLVIYNLLKNVKSQQDSIIDTNNKIKNIKNEIEQTVKINIMENISPIITNSIQPTLNLALIELNNMRQDIMNSINISAYNASLSINNNIRTIYQDVKIIKNDITNIRQEIDYEVNSLKTEISNIKSIMFDYRNEIVNLGDELISFKNILNNDIVIVNDELDKKINYLFEFFYHSDSKTIMDNYPILDNN